MPGMDERVPPFVGCLLKFSRKLSDYGMNRLCPLRFLPFLLAIVLSPVSLAWGAAGPIKATAVYVEGKVTVFSVTDSKVRTVVVGTAFREGDRVKTESNGVVEIEFDTKDLIRLDKNTDMTIKSLRRNEKGSTFSVFNLLVGRVKSAVSKLADKDSKFEYHTKAAICGVAGTPPFIVEFRKNQAFVDLLGKKGEEGAVYVRGFDPAKTLVTVFAGNRTTVQTGMPPLEPFPISTSRLRQLNKTMPFKIKPPKERIKEKQGPKTGEKKEEKKPEEAPQPPSEPPSKPGAPSVEEKMIINNLTRKVSVPRQTSPEQAKSVAGVENRTTQEQGIIGQKVESGGEIAPPVTTTTIDVIIDLK